MAGYMAYSYQDKRKGVNMYEIITTASSEIQIVYADSLEDLVRKYPEAIYAKQIR
jgi:hypothetical protein